MPDTPVRTAPLNIQRLGICSALAQEQAGIRALMADATPVQRAGREFLQGHIEGLEVVLALTGIGKVAAATTAVVLIEHFGVQAMLFTGVAGGLAAQARVGDVVLADELLQHDMDASPLFPRHQVPLYGISRFTTHPTLTDLMHEAARTTLPPDGGVHRGLIVSGDCFVSSQAQSDLLRQTLPDALAVEMEGAALAQVCHDYHIPCAVLRTVSDRADDSAHGDFLQFVRDVASHHSLDAVRGTLAHLAQMQGHTKSPSPTPTAVAT